MLELMTADYERKVRFGLSIVELIKTDRQLQIHHLLFQRGISQPIHFFLTEDSPNQSTTMLQNPRF